MKKQTYTLAAMVPTVASTGDMTQAEKSLLLLYYGGRHYTFAKSRMAVT